MAANNRIGTVIGFLAAASICAVSIYLGKAKAQEEADNPEASDLPRLTQKVRQIDLGDGVTLTEITGESKDGDVWLRETLIRRHGNFLMQRGWNKLPFGEKKGETLVQTYYCDGQEVAYEIEQQDNGGSHLLCLSDKEGLPLYAFYVKRNGELVPVQGDRLKKMREGGKLFGDCLEPIVEGAKKSVGEQEMERRIEKAIKKARDGREKSEEERE